MEDAQEKASLRVKSCLRKKLFTKTDFCKMIGISRPTLYLRLEKGDWRKNELDIIFNETDF